MAAQKLLTTSFRLHTLPPSIRQSIFRTLISDSPSTSIPRSSAYPRLSTRSASTTTDPQRLIQPLVPAPRENSGPLLSRLPNRALPDLPSPIISIWLKTLPLFVLLVTVSSLAIFNYEKSSSSTVNSILYALRLNDSARELLGDEIYFASQVPWIKGELSPMQGIINIRFMVKGTKGKGEVKFVSLKRGKPGERRTYFETVEWSLKMEDGSVVQLLEDGGKDVLKGAGVD